MKLVQAKGLLTVMALAAALSLSACGGGGSNDAAATPSGTDPKPVQEVPVIDVQTQKLAAGAGYSLAVTSAGKVLSWGTGMHGSVSSSSTIAAVGTASWGTNLNASWVVTSTGDLLYWGDDASGSLTANAVVLSGLGQVAAARACGAGNAAMLYVLKRDGTVWAVPARSLTTSTKGFAVTGVGQAKALGDGTDTTCSSMLALDKDGGVWQLHATNPGDGAGVPTQAQGVAVSGLSKVVQAACAESSCLAVDEVGQVLAWGNNNVGQLGDGTRLTSAVPLVVSVAKTRSVWMTPGGAAYAITTSGALYGWGQLDGRVKSTSTGDLGTSPTLILSTGFAVQGLSVSPSATAHTLVQIGDGSVWGWGQNGSAELTAPASSTPLIDLTKTGVSLL